MPVRSEDPRFGEARLRPHAESREHRQNIGRVLIGKFSRAYYIGVSRITFSTLASSTVSVAKCSSAATWAAVI
jgi:hypothetical protein